MQRNASKHIKHAVSLLTFKKENMPRSSISSPHKNFIIMLHDLYNTKQQMSCELLLFTTTAFIFRFCVVMPQRSETVVYVTCIVYATAMTLRIFFLLRYSFQPAKHKEQLGQKNQTYVFISNFPAATVPAMHIVHFVRFI